MSESTPIDGRVRLGRWLLLAGGLCGVLPFILVALTSMVGTAAGWLGVLSMIVLWPVGTLLVVVGFLVLVIRGRAGAAYEDRPGNF